MHRWLSLLLAAALVSGCQARPRISASASGPQEIAVLTTQIEVYTCPHCGMDYDRAGQCPMCKVDLVRSRIDYICPADHRPVEPLVPRHRQHRRAACPHDRPRD